MAIRSQIVAPPALQVPVLPAEAQMQIASQTIFVKHRERKSYRALAWSKITMHVCMAFHLPRCATRVLAFRHDQMPIQRGRRTKSRTTLHVFPIPGAPARLPCQPSTRRQSATRFFRSLHCGQVPSWSQKSYSELVSFIPNLLITQGSCTTEANAPWPVPVMAPMMVPVRPDPERRWTNMLLLRCVPATDSVSSPYLTFTCSPQFRCK